mmetsp:Transcript_4263/g.5660  ORF Transcript_4263/g.5660 Transcript_4263/m.5660 type:complete len:284 (+) Transcript_4263:249-1100(+)
MSVLTFISSLLLLFLFVPSQCTTVEHTGYLIDRYCWLRTIPGVQHAALDTSLDLSRFPETHTTHCLIEIGICYRSGFLVLEKIPDTKSYRVKYLLDDAGNSKAIRALENSPKLAPNLKYEDGDYLVTVKGIVGGNYDGTESEFSGVPILQVSSLQEVGAPLITDTPSKSPLTSFPSVSPSISTSSPTNIPVNTTSAPNTTSPTTSPTLGPSFHSKTPTEPEGGTGGLGGNNPEDNDDDDDDGLNPALLTIVVVTAIGVAFYIAIETKHKFCNVNVKERRKEAL